MRLLFLIAIAMMISSCTYRTFSTEVIASTKSHASPDFTAIAKVEEEACHRMFLFFGTAPDYQKVYQKLLDQARENGGDAIVDFHTRPTTTIWVLPLFLYSQCFDVVGTSVKFQNNGASKWDAQATTEEAPASAPAKSAWDAKE